MTGETVGIVDSALAVPALEGVPAGILRKNSNGLSVIVQTVRPAGDGSRGVAHSCKLFWSETVSKTSKFMFVYRSQQDPDMSPPSPEEMQQIMTAWHAWFAEVGDKLVDGGDWLLPHGMTVRQGGVVSDGPFIEGKEMVGGYSIVQTETVQEAAELAKSCPVLHDGGGWVEIRLMAGTS